MRPGRFLPRPLAALGLAAALVLLSAGCYGPNSRVIDRNGPFRSSGERLVLGPDELFRQPGNVLTTLTTHFPAVRVINDVGCPRVVIRGARRLQGPSDPQVYLDGQPALDTCLLGMLRASDMELVEVYPLGVTSRAGYHSHSFGLILLFSRHAQDGGRVADSGEH